MVDDAQRDPAVGRVRRLFSRFTTSSAELEAEDLREESRERGATPVTKCRIGERVVVSGTIRSLTLRPVGGVPALEAQMFDGSGSVTLVWLGRRTIAGIDPGRSLTATGRITRQGGAATIFNPSYELHA